MDTLDATSELFGLQCPHFYEIGPMVILPALRALTNGGRRVNDFLGLLGKEPEEEKLGRGIKSLSHCHTQLLETGLLPRTRSAKPA